MEPIKFQLKNTSFAWKQELNANDIVEGKHQQFLVKTLDNNIPVYYLIAGKVTGRLENDTIYIAASVIKAETKEVFNFHSSLGAWSKTPNGRESVLRCS